jgi:hypothetical protein
MRKILILSLTTFLAVVLAYGFADAAGPCADCHTMHYSQNGARPANAALGGPFGMLLVADGCMGCHGQGTAENIVNSQIPQVLHSDTTGGDNGDLAGGNFAYITGVKLRDATDSGATKDTVGHNVIDLGAAYYEDTIPNLAANFPPGDENTNFTNGLIRTTFTCAGAYGCHGDRAVTGELAAMKGAHHVSDTMLKFGTINETTQGDVVGHSYRFLLGVHGGEDDDWQNTSSQSAHNEYKGATSRGTESTRTSPGGSTISGLCAECHGNFHGTGSGDIGTASPWLRHPTDIVLPSDVTKEYYLYNGGTGTNNAYSLNAPVARATIPNASSGNVNPGTSDSIVMCLSCHKAHATANADILRWNYEDIQVGAGGNEKCFICHTTKND